MGARFKSCPSGVSLEPSARVTCCLPPATNAAVFTSLKQVVSASIAQIPKVANKCCISKAPADPSPSYRCSTDNRIRHLRSHLEETRLIFLPRADFESLYRTNPDVAQAIIRALGRRLRHLVHVTETLAFRDVAARLALLLVGYAERTGRETPEGIELTLDRTQEELAIEIGAARESVSRAMNQLRRKGLIRRIDRDHLLVPDLSRLRALLPASDGEKA